MAYREVLAVLADPTRRSVFERLGRREHTVGELAKSLRVTQPAVSQHLRHLRKAKLVTWRAAGTRRYYRANREGLVHLRRYIESFWAGALAAFAAARPRAPRERQIEMNQANLPPIVQAVRVSWSPADSFERFTSRFAEWWPRETHSIGGPRVERIVFETHVGGRIFEQHSDGRRFQWGKVVEWDAPRRVRFTWHPSREERTAQDVTIEFLPEGSGTQVILTAGGWERWGEGAAKARKMYNMGWGYVLNLWGQKRSLKMSLIGGLGHAIRMWQKIRGKTELQIEGDGGEIEPAHKVSAAPERSF